MGIGSKAVDISASAVTNNLSSLLTRMLKAVSACPIENDAWAVDTIRFTVAVTRASFPSSAWSKGNSMASPAWSSP